MGEYSILGLKGKMTFNTVNEIKSNIMAMKKPRQFLFILFNLIFNDCNITNYNF